MKKRSFTVVYTRNEREKASLRVLEDGQRLTICPRNNLAELSASAVFYVEHGQLYWRRGTAQPHPLRDGENVQVQLGPDLMCLCAFEKYSDAVEHQKLRNSLLAS